MIREINAAQSVWKSNFSANNKNSTERNASNATSENTTDLAMMPVYKNNISFKAEKRKRTPIDKAKELEDNYTIMAQELVNRAEKYARKYNSPEITQIHVMRASMDMVGEHIDDLNSGKIHFAEKTNFLSQLVYSDIISKDLFSNKDLRDKFKPAVIAAAKELDEYLEKNRGEAPIPEDTELSLSKSYVNDLYLAYSIQCAHENSDVMEVGDNTLLGVAADTRDPRITAFIEAVLTRMQGSIMLDKKEPSKNVHLQFYDDKARNIWQNLSKGSDMFILHEAGCQPGFLVNSFTHLLNSDDETFGKFNRENTEIITINKYIKDNFLIDMVAIASKNRDKNHIIIFDYNKMLSNAEEATMQDDFEDNRTIISPVLWDIFAKPPENVRFVAIIDRDSFYGMSESTSEKSFDSFGDVAFTPLTMEQTKQVLKTEKALLDKIDIPFSDDATDKCVEASEKLKGHFPDKALKIMKRIAKANVDKKMVTLDDVDEFIRTSKDMFTKNDEDKASVAILDNTKVKLADILGTKSTKDEAASIVKAIKDKTIGTTGFIIYSEDGLPGGGRKHTAKAIAGEAEIPYFGIDTSSFGTKDVDLFGYGNISPEKSMTKLWSEVKDKADNNSSKAAVLFIENFEYFSAGEYVSEYHQSAMAQMLREMDTAEKQGYNIAVIGSVSNPKAIDDTTLKSAKFSDLIEIESPAHNIEARKDIIKHYLKEYKIEIAGNGESEKIIQNVASTTEDFPFIQILTFLKKAKIVANERSHEKVELGDFTEAYLRTISGRMNSSTIFDHEKAVTTSHECGHALTMHVMYELLKSQNKPWQIPDQVNFITLDPRSGFKGAMFYNNTENKEVTLAGVISDIVCCFGGHSTEKQMYSMDGSWGITADMSAATRAAKLAVQYMGMGARTGKISFWNGHNGTNKFSSRIMGKVDRDIEVMLKNSNLISDKIVQEYMGFVNEFTERYKVLVGTGNCTVSGDQFRKEFAEWKASQSPEKQEELKKLDKEILNIIGETRKGKLVKAS